MLFATFLFRILSDKVTSWIGHCRGCMWVRVLLGQLLCHGAVIPTWLIHGQTAIQYGLGPARVHAILAFEGWRTRGGACAPCYGAVDAGASAGAPWSTGASARCVPAERPLSGLNKKAPPLGCTAGNEPERGVGVFRWGKHKKEHYWDARV